MKFPYADTDHRKGCVCGRAACANAKELRELKDAADDRAERYKKTAAAIRGGIMRQVEVCVSVSIEPLDSERIARLFNVPNWLITEEKPSYSGIPADLAGAFDFEVKP